VLKWRPEDRVTVKHLLDQTWLRET
jgi:hypothetical protein